MPRRRSLDERFTRLADAISELSGRWWVSFVSAVALGIWVGYGIWGLGNTWFTSAAWNFPLNTVTTVGEWFLGLLVLAAANRNERRIQQMLHEIRKGQRSEIKEIGEIRETLEKTSE